MTNIILKQCLTTAKTLILTIAFILAAFAGAAFADNIYLDMEGTTATIPKGNTVERRIYGIPAGIPGDLRLKMKWHAVNIIPNTFNALKIQVLHGDTILKTVSCYSIHSNKSPKCDFPIAVSQTEAEKTGNWKLKVTNNSNDEVIGFNIERESSEFNPLVPPFKSTYTPDCPDTVKLDMEGTTLTLGKGNTQERILYGIGKAAGVLRLKAKWHAVNILPTYNSLRIELLKPNGQVALSGTYFSVHSDKSPKFDITYNISAADAALSGSWKLKIVNNSNFEVVGFNIEKESSEFNRLVPSFHSTYKANCSF